MALRAVFALLSFGLSLVKFSKLTFFKSPPTSCNAKLSVSSGVDLSGKGFIPAFPPL